MPGFFSSRPAQVGIYGAATVGMGVITVTLGLFSTGLALTILGLPAAISFGFPLAAECADCTREFAEQVVSV
jgi:hypothetical protein